MKLEIEAKAFALNEASKKTCNFNAYLLAQFVDKTFREIYPDDVIYFANDSNVFIRSVESCRADLSGERNLIKIPIDLILKDTSAMMWKQKDLDL